MWALKWPLGTSVISLHENIRPHIGSPAALEHHSHIPAVKYHRNMRSGSFFFWQCICLQHPDGEFITTSKHHSHFGQKIYYYSDYYHYYEVQRGQDPWSIMQFMTQHFYNSLLLGFHTCTSVDKHCSDAGNKTLGRERERQSLKEE